MPQPKSVRKPPRVVFSLGMPSTTERRTARMAKRMKITRNAFIVAAVEEMLARAEENAEQVAAA